MDTAFSTSTKREQFADFNKSMATNKSNNAKVEPTPVESDTTKLDPAQIEEEGRPGVRIVRIPSKKLANKTGNKASPKVKKIVKKDADDLELGDEASTIKNDEEKQEEEEEADVQIEIVDCFPLPCTTR